MKNTKSDNNKAKPFLKWAGGKRQIIDELESFLPMEFRSSRRICNYVEPFVGGGAFFFYLQSFYEISKSLIIDVNPELFIAYSTVKNDPESLIRLLSSYQEEYYILEAGKREIYYYEIRNNYNHSGKAFDYSNDNNRWIERVAQLIFLNRTCFNGLFRQNSKGEFNVPYGNYKNPTICNAENILECSKALKNTDILQGDFSISKKFIDTNTLVYLDPPYRPINKTSSFTSYSKDGFNDTDQKRLAEFYKEMSSIGTYLLLSNSDPKNENPKDSFFEDIYHEFNIVRISASRMINCIGAKRGEVKELIITNYPKGEL